MLGGGGTEMVTHRRTKDDIRSTKDELEQYRAILEIHGREKKLRTRDAIENKKRVSRRLITFRRDVDAYRRIANDLRNGLIASSTSLPGHGRRAENLYTSIKEETHRKRLRLDRLRYEKKRKMKRCFELQLERAVLCDHQAKEEREPWARCGTQRYLVTHFQRSVAKNDAAKAINLTYLYILGILKEDAVHRETLLNALEQDRKERGVTMLQVVMMGQLAVEESDDVAERCERVARLVWANSKERENALTVVRGRVKDLWMYARSLIRTESETGFSMEMANTSGFATSTSLNARIQSLEEVIEKVEDSLLVRSYRELLSRLEEQTKRRNRLLERFEQNVKECESLLVKKNKALSVLSDVERTLLAAVEDYKADKNVLLERIAMQKKLQSDRKSSREERGKLLMDVRSSLQHMVAMLVCVRRGGTNRPVKKPTTRLDKKSLSREDTEVQDREDTISRSDMPVAIEKEGLTLLSTVSRKVGALFGMSHFEFDPDREERAKDLYRTYVSDFRSQFMFADVKTASTGLFVESKAIDTSVPTRADIKLKSKQAVETRLRLQ